MSTSMNLYPGVHGYGVWMPKEIIFPPFLRFLYIFIFIQNFFYFAPLLLGCLGGSHANCKIASTLRWALHAMQHHCRDICDMHVSTVCASRFVYAWSEKKKKKLHSWCNNENKYQGTNTSSGIGRKTKGTFGSLHLPIDSCTDLQPVQNSTMCKTRYHYSMCPKWPRYTSTHYILLFLFFCYFQRISV